MKRTVLMVEPIRRNGKWDVIQYEKEVEIPHPEREKELCTVCLVDDYPNCTTWCGQYPNIK